MNKQDECRYRAKQALIVAARTDDDDFRAMMLQTAQAWVELADRADKRKHSMPSRRQMPDRKHILS
jgi:hypothetical protein